MRPDDRRRTKSGAMLARIGGMLVRTDAAAVNATRCEAGDNEDRETCRLQVKGRAAAVAARPTESHADARAGLSKVCAGKADQRAPVLRENVAVTACPCLAVLLAATLASWPLAIRAECRVSSVEHTVAVIELYTSEGCDSCPPADRWLSGFARSADASRAIALAFHVDYWDRLGWRDRFASEGFTARQHEQAERQHAAFVYTPQILLQGGDFRAWRASGQPDAAIAAINAQPARAKIELSATGGDRGTTAVDVRVRIPQARDRAHAAVAVALVQDGLASDVRAGENAGKRLAHDRVVRQWRAEATRLDAAGEAEEQVVFALPADVGPLSIVALAEDAATGTVLQAVSLPLCAR